MVNFQIPGDPPVSIVTYYVLPQNWMEIHKDKENIEGFKKYVLVQAVYFLMLLLSMMLV